MTNQDMRLLNPGCVPRRHPYPIVDKKFQLASILSCKTYRNQAFTLGSLDPLYDVLRVAAGRKPYRHIPGLAEGFDLPCKDVLEGIVVCYGCKRRRIGGQRIPFIAYPYLRPLDRPGDIVCPLFPTRTLELSSIPLSPDFAVDFHSQEALICFQPEFHG